MENWRIALAISLVALFPGHLQGQTNVSTPGCQDIATLPPVLTFGGPGTVSPGGNELGLGAGAFGNLFPAPCAHDTGIDWFGRWRHGLTDRFDLGVDFLGLEHSSDQALSVKLAARYEILKNLRLETGFGFGDDTKGKSLTAEVGATVGIPGLAKNWGGYASLRLAGAHGLAGNLFGIGTTVPPGALVPMASFGVSPHISRNAKWILEGGGGAILSREHINVGMFVYVGVGMDFELGKKK